jgi:hypothetical protein
LKRPQTGKATTSQQLYLVQLSGEVVGQALFLLLVVERQVLLLLLELLDLLEQRVRDKLLLLFSLGLKIERVQVISQIFFQIIFKNKMVLMTINPAILAY